MVTINYSSPLVVFKWECGGESSIIDQWGHSLDNQKQAEIQPTGSGSQPLTTAPSPSPAANVGTLATLSNHPYSFQGYVDTACEKYKVSVLNKIEQYNNSQKPEPVDSQTGSFALAVENNVLKEIFYSPKTNSCLYWESRRFLAKSNAKPDVGNWFIDTEDYYLVDVLTGKEVNFYEGLPFMQIIHSGEVFNSEETGYAVVSQYKY